MTTKVRFTATIEIDTQEWAENYGMDPKAIRAIQDDVRSYIFDMIHQMPVAPLDQKTLRLYPQSFTQAKCYLCGEVAARWNGSKWNDTKCNACDERDEAKYAAQGGQ